MAAFVLTDAYIAINSVDRSAFIKQVALNVETAEQDATDFADAGWTVPISGLKSGSLALTFNQDVAASQIDSIMWPLLGTTVPFEVRRTDRSVRCVEPEIHGQHSDHVVEPDHRFGR